MTLNDIAKLDIDSILSIYNLTTNQFDDIQDTVNHILDEVDNLNKAIRQGYATKGYRMKIKNSIDYADLYKAVKSKHYSLWTGLISREAYKEYYRAYLLNERPKVTAEHFWNRARVIHEIIEGEWGDILRKHRARGFIYLYFENPGMGKFHITTESENAMLSANQQQNFDLTWQEQYNNLDIELFEGSVDLVHNGVISAQNPLVGTFNSKSQDFWKYIDTLELFEALDLYNINVDKIDSFYNIKQIYN